MGTGETVPVSYTHLDVYKRQEEIRIAHGGKHIMRLHAVIAVVGAQLKEDVYKRQDGLHGVQSMARPNRNVPEE